MHLALKSPAGTSRVHTLGRESVMDEFIQLAINNLGLSESTARTAAGGLLKSIQNQVGGEDARQLMLQLPGSEALVKNLATQSESKESGGLVSKIGFFFGGNVDAATGLVGILDETGLGVDKIGPFTSLFVYYLKGKVNYKLVDRILRRMPELQRMLY
jgi:hypothetical protein